jgi:hypothetical protein
VAKKRLLQHRDIFDTAIVNKKSLQKKSKSQVNIAFLPQIPSSNLIFFCYRMKRKLLNKLNYHISTLHHLLQNSNTLAHIA